MFKLLTQVLAFSLLVSPTLGMCDDAHIPCDRRLVQTNNSDVANLKANCVKEDYDLSLFVGNHIVVVATPAAASNANPDCQQTTIFHDVHGDKVVISLESEEDVGVVLGSESLLPVGTFSMGKILKAHEDAKAMDTTGGSVWDVVTNNCGTYALSMGKNLGIDPKKNDNDYIVEYIVERVSDENNMVLEQLKASPNVKMILLKGLGLEDHTETMLLRRFVDFYIKMHA